MTNYELFISLNEPFAAGLFEFEDASPLIRYANALRRFFEETPLTPYNGEKLYPAGKCVYYNHRIHTVLPHYSNTFNINFAKLEEKNPLACRLMQEEYNRVINFLDSPHCVGGMGWTHSFPNYTRIMKEGLDSYAQRVNLLKDSDFKKGLLIVLDGIRAYHKRCIEHLRDNNAPENLIQALLRVPFQSPQSFYEALLAVNFIFYVDGCDDIGPLDRTLLPYHKNESLDELEDLFREFFKNVNRNDGWSGTLGPDYNVLTRACIRAIKNGRRPNLQLLVKKDMPQWVWDECKDSLASSCGQPAFYNYELYRNTLTKIMPQVPKEDLDRMAFGGCTETMFEGLSAVGSDDAGINSALIFSGYMRRELENCSDYEEFYRGFTEEFRKVFLSVTDRLNEYRKTRALYRPLMVRTLLVDDCIDNETEFNAGGARYVYSEINIAGLINVIDSLNVIKTLVYEKSLFSPAEFIALMDARDPQFLHAAKSCPSYGNDNEKADLIGTRLIDDVSKIFALGECYPRGKFYPVLNQFSTFADAGKKIPATPDGREAGAPLCDSMSAIHNNDNKGPTALLNSVSRLELSKIIGTPITNIRLSKNQLYAALPYLVNSYFENGGMQLQVSCLSREDILDAMAHPEKHGSLVVRIGGYSEYFTRLSPELQKTVLERTEH